MSTRKRTKRKAFNDNLETAMTRCIEANRKMGTLKRSTIMSAGKEIDVIEFDLMPLLEEFDARCDAMEGESA